MIMSLFPNLTEQDKKILELIHKFYAEINDVEKSTLIQKRLIVELGLTVRLMSDLMELRK